MGFGFRFEWCFLSHLLGYPRRRFRIAIVGRFRSRFGFSCRSGRLWGRLGFRLRFGFDDRGNERFCRGGKCFFRKAGECPEECADGRIARQPFEDKFEFPSRFRAEVQGSERASLDEVCRRIVRVIRQSTVAQAECIFRTSNLQIERRELSKERRSGLGADLAFK
jgi:hypothetical protein